MANRLFDSAEYRSHADPLHRLLGYVDLRISILRGALPEYTCLLGTMVQEVYDTHPQIRAACERYLMEHVQDLERDVEAAKKLYAPDVPWTAESLAFHIQAVIQGSFILAKAKHDEQVAAGCLRHLRRYIETVFSGSFEKTKSGRSRT
jgi:TetR/AcrR family transcriptional repressor of nem operon